MRHWTQNAKMHKRESASKQHSQEIKIRSEVDHLFSLLTFEFVLKLPKLYGSASDAGAARGAIIQIRWNVLGTRACVIIVFAQNNTLPAACTVSNVHWILSYLNEVLPIKVGLRSAGAKVATVGRYLLFRAIFRSITLTFKADLRNLISNLLANYIETNVRISHSDRKTNEELK